MSQRIVTVESSSLLRHKLSWILSVARDDTFKSYDTSMRAERPTKLCKIAAEDEGEGW